MAKKEGLVVGKFLTTVTGGAGNATAEHAVDLKEEDGFTS